MSRKKNRLAAGKPRSNGRSNVMQIHKKVKEQGHEIATRVVKDGQLALEKKKVSRQVTPLEHANVKLNQAREKNLEQQKIIAKLRKEKAEAELRADQLEIKLQVVDNEAFRRDVGLTAGLNLLQDVQSGDWYWEKAPEELGVQTIAGATPEPDPEPEEAPEGDEPEEAPEEAEPAEEPEQPAEDPQDSPAETATA